MKRWSPIIFIWLMSLVCTITISILSIDKFSEFFAWSSTSVFLLNLIIYHLWVTKEDKQNDDLLDG